MLGGRPDWYKLSELVMSDIRMLSESDRLLFINALCEMTEKAMDPDYLPEQKEGFVGRAISRQFEVLRDGVASYMAKVTANPSGKSKLNGEAIATHRGGESEREEKTMRSEQEQIQNKIRSELQAAGYALDEINSALSSVDDWTAIENKSGYVVRIIRNNRRKQPGKTMSAQQYTQRDYGTEDEAAWARQLALLKEEA